MLPLGNDLPKAEPVAAFSPSATTGAADLPPPSRTAATESAVNRHAASQPAPARRVAPPDGPDPADAEWLKSPCSTCSTSPCCTHLPVYRFRMENRKHAEFAVELLRHERIEIGLYESGWWMVYYQAPCRFLDLENSKCTVHGTPRKPQICASYSPVRCWYRRVFAADISPDFIRFDLARFQRLAALLRYDESGGVESAPEWEEMLALFSDLPLPDAGKGVHRIPVGAPDAALVHSAPRALAPAGVSPVPAQLDPLGVVSLNLADQTSPRVLPSVADGAGVALESPTPTTQLIFPMRTPERPQDFDLLKFRLGFPGVRVGISEAGWVLVIQCQRWSRNDERTLLQRRARSLSSGSDVPGPSPASVAHPEFTIEAPVALGEATVSHVVAAPAIVNLVMHLQTLLKDYEGFETAVEATLRPKLISIPNRWDSALEDPVEGPASVSSAEI